MLLGVSLFLAVMPLQKTSEWTFHEHFQPSLLDSLYEGNDRCLDPTIIAVCYFADWIPAEYGRARTIQSESLPFAQRLLDEAAESVRSHEIHRNDLVKAESSKYEFFRGLTRYIAANYPSPTAKIDPKEFKELANRSFRRGADPKLNKPEKSTLLDFASLCQLGLVWTSSDLTAAEKELKLLVDMCPKGQRWVALRGEVAVLEMLELAGRVAEARERARKVMTAYGELSKWGSYCKASRLATGG